MTSAILRGFDFPARSIGDQLRFCNPLISFGDSEAAPIFLARDLDWRHEGEDGIRWLTPIDTDEVASFATLVSGKPQQIRPGEGIVLMGEDYFSAVRKMGIDPGRDGSVKFEVIPEAQCRVGLANVAGYEQFARRLTGDAARIFDGELLESAGEKLSAIGEAALFLLRKCGLTPPTDLAIRQLVAARVTGQTDRYRRLLTRFSLELGDKEGDIHERVDRHLEVAMSGIERTTNALPGNDNPFRGNFTVATAAVDPTTVMTEKPEVPFVEGFRKYEPRVVTAGVNESVAAMRRCKQSTWSFKKSFILTSFLIVTYKNYEEMHDDMNPLSEDVGFADISVNNMHIQIKSAYSPEGEVYIGQIPGKENVRSREKMEYFRVGPDLYADPGPEKLYEFSTLNTSWLSRSSVLNVAHTGSSL